MGPLNDENKLQVEEKNNKNWVWKHFENVLYYKLYDYSQLTDCFG